MNVGRDLRFRAAASQDAALLWAWASDPVVRGFAFTSDPISWDEHLRWLSSRLSASECLIAIVEQDGMPVGQVRVERGAIDLEIDIAVAAAERGRGIGRQLLAHGVAAAATRWPRGTRLVAKVIEGNDASMRLFDCGGFTRVGFGTHESRSYVTFERLL